MERHQRAQVISGILLVALGLIFLAGQMGWPIVAGLTFGRLWPVLLFVVGVGRLMVPGEGRGGRAGGLWLIFVAGVFLLNNFGVLPLSRSWPLFIVAAGASLLLGSGPHRRGIVEGGRRAD